MGGQRPGPIGLTDHPVIDPGTACRDRSPLPGPLCSFRQSERPFFDELTPIAQYIAGEMNANARGEAVRRMAEMNRFSADVCIADFNKLPWWRQLFGVRPEDCLKLGMSFRAAALMAWAMKVRQDGEWDHKPKIARLFHPRVPHGRQNWHLFGETLYFYDVWSNIHYGYVGRAAGFSAATLLDGAGLEQIGSDAFALNVPGRSANVSGLRAWDNPEDRAAIEMGIDLYDGGKNSISAQDIMARVLRSNSINRKPYRP